MTDKESLALKPGDRVIKLGSRLGYIFVIVKPAKPGSWLVLIRREGVTKDGRPHRAEWWSMKHLELHSRYDPLTANIYADFLDEHGEPRAADLLRKAFPMDQGVTV